MPIISIPLLIRPHLNESGSDPSSCPVEISAELRARMCETFPHPASVICVSSETMRRLCAEIIFSVLSAVQYRSIFPMTFGAFWHLRNYQRLSYHESSRTVFIERWVMDDGVLA